MVICLRQPLFYHSHISSVVRSGISFHKIDSKSCTMLCYWTKGTKTRNITVNVYLQHVSLKYYRRKTGVEHLKSPCGVNVQYFSVYHLALKPHYTICGHHTHVVVC